MQAQEPIMVQLGTKVGWIVTRYADCVIARCNTLGLTACADTIEELPEIIDEILDDLFHSLISEGLLDEFLKKRGWIQHPQIQISQMLNSDTPIHIPWEIIYKAGRGEVEGQNNRKVICEKCRKTNKL
jgi:hypothetical protein